MAVAAVSSTKQSLRAELKRRLRALSAEERLRQSRLLAQKVFTHSQYQKSKRISIFLSMQDEIETEEIIKDIFQQGKTCFIPRYQFQSNHMDMVKLASPEEISSLPKTSWNIHQPSEVEVREEALSTGSLLSSTTSEPVEMRVCQWDLPFYFSTLTTIFLVILGPCKVDLKISQRLAQLKVVNSRRNLLVYSDQTWAPTRFLSQFYWPHETSWRVGILWTQAWNFLSVSLPFLLVQFG
ncbi:5-formyltetrahydrofolate cyclo-ligase isoform X2 [Physeter macrocephalus]|uniref:5-formyltetrahydrofolate cyclo-ligase n=1 Tax=Physeter macrocephalus TaxID=9755 RepID=A0A455BT76_PHYMC|nr:5-formyltetrahydrofolate cyclo-ligase isoform X2 [Physeter catodon]|eukprot:XP_028352195.1 5-formyltetrahydrofolate cyclo-ligase isoform X1 [Physeter catodon]